MPGSYEKPKKMSINISVDYGYSVENKLATGHRACQISQHKME
jgi:hypothetical protein